MLTAEKMEKELVKYGIKEPLSIMEKAIRVKTSLAIPEIKATLHWIYNGNKEWNLSGNNSTDVNDYLFQLINNIETEIKINEKLEKFAEKYDWKLEVWHGEYKGVLCGVQDTNPGEDPLPLYRFPGGVSLA